MEQYVYELEEALILTLKIYKEVAGNVYSFYHRELDEDEGKQAEVVLMTLR